MLEKILGCYPQKVKIENSLYTFLPVQTTGRMGPGESNDVLVEHLWAKKSVHYVNLNRKIFFDECFHEIYAKPIENTDMIPKNLRYTENRIAVI